MSLLLLHTSLPPATCGHMTCPVNNSDTVTDAKLLAVYQKCMLWPSHLFRAIMCVMWCACQPYVGLSCGMCVDHGLMCPDQCCAVQLASIYAAYMPLHSAKSSACASAGQQNI